MSGKFGVKGGNMRAQNNQAGKVAITVDASGNGSGTATFRQGMKHAPFIGGLVANTSTDALTTGILTASTVTTSGFKIWVKGSSIVSGVVNVGYNAFDDRFR